jgi:hypothetical protein
MAITPVDRICTSVLIVKVHPGWITMWVSLARRPTPILGRSLPRPWCEESHRWAWRRWPRRSARIPSGTPQGSCPSGG